MGAFSLNFLSGTSTINVKTKINALKLPEKLELLITEFNYLQNLLGFEIFTHPSGSDRIKLVNEYLKDSSVENNKETFKKVFVKIWNMK